MHHAGFKKNIYFSFTEGPFLGDDKSKYHFASASKSKPALSKAFLAAFNA